MFVCLFGCFVLFVCSVFCICKNCQIPKTERYFQEISRCSRFCFVLFSFSITFFFLILRFFHQNHMREKSIFSYSFSTSFLDFDRSKTTTMLFIDFGQKKKIKIKPEKQKSIFFENKKKQWNDVPEKNNRNKRMLVAGCFFS